MKFRPRKQVSSLLNSVSVLIVTNSSLLQVGPDTREHASHAPLPTSPSNGPKNVGHGGREINVGTEARQ